MPTISPKPSAAFATATTGTHRPVAPAPPVTLPENAATAGPPNPQGAARDDPPDPATHVAPPSIVQLRIDALIRAQSEEAAATGRQEKEGTALSAPQGPGARS